MGVLIIGAFGSCVGGGNDYSSPAPPISSPQAGGSGGAYEPAPAAGELTAKRCSYGAATVYDGLSCVPGGERVAVSRAVDGDTLELSDGRRVRLLAVDSPEQGECGFNEATEYTSSRTAGKHVWLFREPGVTTDQYGRELAYVDMADQYGASDLGYSLITSGHAELSSDSNANDAYEERLRSAASYSYGSCEQPTYTPQENYDAPDPGDGDDGESRYCRRKWWC